MAAHHHNNACDGTSASRCPKNRAQTPTTTIAGFYRVFISGQLEPDLKGFVLLHPRRMEYVWATTRKSASDASSERGECFRLPRCGGWISTDWDRSSARGGNTYAEIISRGRGRDSRRKKSRRSPEGYWAAEYPYGHLTDLGGPVCKHNCLRRNPFRASEDCEVGAYAVEGMGSGRSQRLWRCPQCRASIMQPSADQD
jgi:hypothetical protein